jgi:hypothetical protein
MKHTTLILPSDKISKEELRNKIEAKIKSLKINREYNYTRAGVILGLKYVLSLLNEMR